MYSTQLRAFHAVASHGGFTKAANRLGLTQPAVSDHVRKLEQRFDVQLFHRHKRTVFPTELGVRLLEITRRQFELEDEAIELLQESQALRAGNLKIALGAPFHIVEVIAAFQAEYPGVQISLTQGNSNEVLTQLLEYGADIGELGEAPDDERLLVMPLRADRMVAFVRKDHKWAKRKKITLTELSQETLVLREPGSATRRITEQELDRLKIKPPLVLNVEGREASREAVAAGLGVGIVSEPEFGHDERLTSIELSDGKAVMTESIVCLKERANLRIIKAFLDVARAHLRSP
ncbi:MAG: LysR family transcriptional regulator [Rhodospirillaceae bacterium]|jgi:LysR family transcriptional regulator, low CO2-responsive transcriptional regulator|nr:LysR family transcriptional regulator [Rhodospirillaceae bacterium]MBT6139440.1 LysR family transcriptional regulator [Rhodospirillaceae bacterium]